MYFRRFFRRRPRRRYQENGSGFPPKPVRRKGIAALFVLVALLLFMAPHVVAQALKTAIFCAAMMKQLGIETSPSIEDKRSDIIQMVKLGSSDKLKKFCLGIQSGAPVDSYVTPEPWAMPGYDDQVIMAAGAFIQGSSIELSADGPMREPYIAYMQGGLTYESGKMGIMMAVSAMLD